MLTLLQTVFSRLWLSPGAGPSLSPSFTPKTPIEIVFLGTSFYVLAGLGIGATRPGSVARWGLLVPVTYITYLIGRHSFNVLPRLLLTNIVAGTVCAAWTQFVVSGFLLRENFEDAGPQPGGSATYPDTAAPKREERDAGARRRRQRRQQPDTLFQRLLFGINTVNSQRNVLTPQRAPYIPPFSRSQPDYLPSKRDFLLTRGAVAVATFLLVDILTSGSGPPPPDPTANPALAFSQDQTALFRLGTATEWQRKATVTFGQWFGLYVVTTWMHSTVAVATVAANVYPPEGWPPLYGSVWDVWSLRQWWGRFWHALLRYKLSATADWAVFRVLGLRRGSFAARYAHLAGVFAASGLCHVMMDVIGPIKLEETYAFRYFALQAVGIALEDGVQW